MGLAAVYIWGTPFVRQVLHVHQPYARMWVMFSGVGKDVCLVDLEQVVDGEREPLDRFELFGHIDRDRAPGWLRFVRNRDPGKALAQRVCLKLGPEADLRMEVRCLQGNAGWAVVREPSTNACEVPP